MSDGSTKQIDDERSPQDRIDDLRGRVRDIQGLLKRQSRMIHVLIQQIEDGEKPADYNTFDHVGAYPDRIAHNPAERIFAESWAEECRRKSYLNHGVGLLEGLLTMRTSFNRYMDGERRAPYVSRRDAFVAATVIQWLGTNCGRAFIDECERKIANDRKGGDS